MLQLDYLVQHSDMMDAIWGSILLGISSLLFMKPTTPTTFISINKKIFDG